MTKEKVNEAELVKIVFSNPQGDELLDYWDDIYNHKQSYHPQNTPEQTAYNEGLRGFYLAIRGIMRGDYE